MVFAYYNRLTPAQKRIYRQSDEIGTVDVPDAQLIQPLVLELAEALKQENRRDIEKICQNIVSMMIRSLDMPTLRVRVLASRPHNDWGELHGLYEPAEGRSSARITVWMRTAQRRKVVAFKTFLRTVLHEFCHHLDYELLGLADSFHTEGFYKRESSLFHQLVSQKP